MLVNDEEANKALFDKVFETRKKLFFLQLQEYNEESSNVDLGVYI
jgi:hypothetical protein